MYVAALLHVSKGRNIVQASVQWREPLTALLHQAARASALGLVEVSAIALLSSLSQQPPCGSDSQPPNNVASEAAVQRVAEDATQDVQDAGQRKRRDCIPCGLRVLSRKRISTKIHSMKYTDQRWLIDVFNFVLVRNRRG